jgi:type I restriction enzyme S subunit
MSNKTKPLHKLCRAITDCHHSTPTYLSEGKLVIRNFNIKNGRMVLDNPSYTSPEEFEHRISRAKPAPGDLIITREAPMGEVCIIPEGVECCLGQRMVLIQPNFNEVDSRYLLYALMSDYAQKQIGKREGTGSIVSNLRIPELENLQVPWRNFDEQQRIGAALRLFDSKLDLNKRVCSELFNFAELAFGYWFMQFDFPNTDGKPYRSSGGRMNFNKTLHRDIPEGWKAGTASDLFEFNPSLSLKKGAVHSYIDMDALPVSGFMTDLPQKKAFNGGMRFQNGDVLVARITPCLENGKTALITLLEDGEIGFGSTEYVVFRGRQRDLRSFAACLARSKHFRRYSISRMIGTSGRKRVDASDLARYKMPIPTDDILRKFESFISPFFKLATLYALENNELAKFRDWALPMFMSGQLSGAQSESVFQGLEIGEELQAGA